MATHGCTPAVLRTFLQKLEPSGSLCVEKGAFAIPLTLPACLLSRDTHTHTHNRMVYVRGERPVYGSGRVNHCVWYLHLRQRADHCSSCLFHINSLSHTLTPLILLLLLAARVDTHTHTYTVDWWQGLPLPHLTANGFIRSSVLIGWLWGDAR